MRPSFTDACVVLSLALETFAGRPAFSNEVSLSQAVEATTTSSENLLTSADAGHRATIRG